MMNNLILNEGDYVTIENVSLRCGKAIQVQPFETKFTEAKISRAVYF